MQILPDSKLTDIFRTRRYVAVITGLNFRGFLMNFYIMGFKT